MGVMSEAFGTADIRIHWNRPDPLTLRGRYETFFVRIFYGGTLRGEVQVDDPTVLLNSSVGVVNGRTQNIVVSYAFIRGTSIHKYYFRYLKRKPPG